MMWSLVVLESESKDSLQHGYYHAELVYDFVSLFSSLFHCHWTIIGLFELLSMMVKHGASVIDG
jgi:hypothetical protein